MNQLITIEELSQLIGLTVRTIRGEVQNQRIPYYRLGKRRGIRFDPKQIEDWLKTKHVQPKGNPWKKKISLVS